MQRIAAFTLALMVSGCGYQTWSPFTGGSNPNMPLSDSENMRRVQGHEPAVAPLTTEPGDIWPGPLAPPQTLQDLEATGGLTPEPEAPVPGSPLSRGIGAPSQSPNPSPGKTTNPGSPPLNPLLRCRVMLRLRLRRHRGAKPVKSSRHRSRHRSRQAAGQDIRQR